MAATRKPAPKDSPFTAVYDDGSVDSAPLFRTEYGRAFGRALFLRPSCYRCPYASITRPGDFTLGDFWGLRPDELPQQQEQGGQGEQQSVVSFHGKTSFVWLKWAQFPQGQKMQMTGTSPAIRSQYLFVTYITHRSKANPGEHPVNFL